MTEVTHYSFLKAFHGAVLAVSRDQYPIAITPSELFEDEQGREDWKSGEWQIVCDIVCGLFNLPPNALGYIPADGLPVYNGEIVLVAQTGNDGIGRIIMMPGLVDPSPPE